VLIRSFREVTGIWAPWLHWPVSAAVAVITLLWIARTRVSELQFALATGTRSEPVLLRPPTRRAAGQAQAGSAVAVRFEPGGDAVAADVGMSLLDVAEKAGQPVEPGCRMGVCGADPVAVLDGMAGLSPESAALRPLDRQRRRDRQRHRRGDGGRLHPPRSPRLRDPHRRAGDARAVQPDGNVPAGLRTFRDAGPVPAAGAVVRRARRACVAEHAGTPDRPAFAGGAARHGGRVAVRPADSGDGRECGRARDRRARPAGQL